MSSTVEISRNEYDDLLKKAKVLEKITDTEGLTPEELDRLKKARLGPGITEDEFLKRHPELQD